MEKTEFTKDDIIKYNTEIMPSVQSVEPIYSIVARARSHRIKGGDDIAIDIHLTGIGIPDANKFIFCGRHPMLLTPLKEEIVLTARVYLMGK